MSIRSVIERSEDDRKHFQNKSYSNINLKVSILKTTDILNKENLSDMMQRLYEREYKIDKVEEVIKLDNVGNDLITINQIMDMFDDTGFNTDTTFSETFKSDFAISYSLGGYIFPFWRKIVNKIFSRDYRIKRILLHKLSPGRKRLHCRIYQDGDGSWYITSHIDEANWFNIFNPKELANSHLKDGTGNYIDGTKIMKIVIKDIDKKLAEKESLYIDINKIYKELSRQ